MPTKRIQNFFSPLLTLKFFFEKFGTSALVKYDHVEKLLGGVHQERTKTGLQSKSKGNLNSLVLNIMSCF